MYDKGILYHKKKEDNTHKNYTFISLNKYSPQSTRISVDRNRNFGCGKGNNIIKTLFQTVLHGVSKTTSAVAVFSDMPTDNLMPLF